MSKDTWPTFPVSFATQKNPFSPCNFTNKKSFWNKNYPTPRDWEALITWLCRQWSRGWAGTDIELPQHFLEGDILSFVKSKLLMWSSCYKIQTDIFTHPPISNFLNLYLHILPPSYDKGWTVRLYLRATFVLLQRIPDPVNHSEFYFHRYSIFCIINFFV